MNERLILYNLHSKQLSDLLKKLRDVQKEREVAIFKQVLII